MRSCSAVHPQTFFTDSIKRSNHASIYDVQTVAYALPVAYYRAHWLKTCNARSRAISDVLNRAAQTKNAAGRMLSFFAALAKMGFAGTMIPEDALATAAQRATGGKMAPRTARAALAELAAAGWIAKSYAPTGRRIETAAGWKTAQICRVTFAQSIFVLINRAKAAESGRSPTRAHNSHHRQNLPTMGWTEKQELKKAPVFPNPNISAATTTSDSETEGAQAPREVDQQSPCQTAKRARPKKRKMIGDSDRIAMVKTWDYFRALIAALLSECGASPLECQIAHAQTDPEYPRIFPAAVRWNDYLFLIERRAREQRRIVTAEIMPALRAFGLGFEPDPDIAEMDLTLPQRRRKELARRARQTMRQAVAAQIDAIPTELLPAAIADRWTAARASAMLYPMLINAGKICLANLTDDEKDLFEQVARSTE